MDDRIFNPQPLNFFLLDANVKIVLLLCTLKLSLKTFLKSDVKYNFYFSPPFAGLSHLWAHRLRESCSLPSCIQLAPSEFPTMTEAAGGE